MAEDEGSELEAKLTLPSLGRRRRRSKAKKSEPLWAQELWIPQAGYEATADEPPAAPEPVWAQELWVAQAATPTAEPAAAPEPIAAPEPEPEPEPEPVLVTPRAPAPIAEPIPEQVSEPAPQPDPVAAAEPAPQRVRRRPSITLPALEGRVAAVVTGVVVGLTGVLLFYLAETGCAAVRGVGSCGTAGWVLLVAIFALAVLEGAALLRAFGIENQTSTSFLAVALVAVVSLLVLVPVADQWWMVIVIPVLAAATFLGSWWISATYGGTSQQT